MIQAKEGCNYQHIAHKKNSEMLVMSETRPTINHIAKSNGDGTGEWIVLQVSIEELRTQKLSELSAKCHEVICAGFITDALGFDVHYRSNENDQLKFNLAANNVNGGYVWEGEALTNHTQEQGQKLLDAFIRHFNAVNLHYADLFAQCKGASTNEAIEAIAWGNSDIQRYPSA